MAAFLPDVTADDVTIISVGRIISVTGPGGTRRAAEGLNVRFKVESDDDQEKMKTAVMKLAEPSSGFVSKLNAASGLHASGCKVSNVSVDVAEVDSNGEGQKGGGGKGDGGRSKGDESARAFNVALIAGVGAVLVLACVAGAIFLCWLCGRKGKVDVVTVSETRMRRTEVQMGREVTKGAVPSPKVAIPTAPRVATAPTTVSKESPRNVVMAMVVAEEPACAANVRPASGRPIGSGAQSPPPYQANAPSPKRYGHVTKASPFG